MSPVKLNRKALGPIFTAVALIAFCVHLAYAGPARMRVGWVAKIRGSASLLRPNAKNREQLKAGVTIVYVGDIVRVRSASSVSIQQYNQVTQTLGPGEHSVEYKESDEERRLSDIVGKLPAAVKSKGATVFRWPCPDLSASPSQLAVLPRDNVAARVEATVSCSDEPLWTGQLRRDPRGLLTCDELTGKLVKAPNQGGIFRLKTTLRGRSVKVGFRLLAPDAEEQLAAALAEAGRERSEVTRTLQRAVALGRARQYTLEAAELEALVEAKVPGNALRRRLSALIAVGYWVRSGSSKAPIRTGRESQPP